MADAALEAATGVDSLSFYGLSKWLGKLNGLVLRADHASTAKNPKAEDSELLERKDELLEAAARLKRAMGSRLENPELTKREKPLAEEFIREQLGRLKAHSSEDKRVTGALERLNGILDRVHSSRTLCESKPVRAVQRQMKQLDADWKEVGPLHEKWEKGKHTFRSNDELQACKRKYNECLKGRASAEERLEQALCVLRAPGDTRDSGDDAPAAAKGWSAMGAKRPATAAKPKPRPANRVSAASAANAWNWGMTLAQRFKAEVSASVRREDEEADEEDEVDGAPSPGPAAAAAPPPPPPRVRPKPAPVPKRAEPEEDEEEGDDDEPPQDQRPAKVVPKPAPPLPPSVASSGGHAGGASASKGVKKTAKGKKGKKKAGKEEEDDEDEVAHDAGDAQPRRKKDTAAWVKEVQGVLSGSLFEELTRKDSWCLLDSDAAEGRREELSELVPLASPLGLSLPISWGEFIALNIDGGPKSTSRRGESPVSIRLQHNIPKLLRHYVTMLFFCMLLQSLSCFGLLLVPAALQAALVVAPPETLHVRPAVGVLLLQAAHALLWLAFARSLWSMHLFIKMFVVLCVCGHAYLVAEVKLEDDGLHEQ